MSDEETVPDDMSSSSSLSLHTIPDDENNYLIDFFDYTDPKYLTKLNIACRANDVETVKKIIDADTELNGIDNVGNTAVHYAAKHGSVDVFRLLMSQKKVRVFTQNHWGDYPLHMVTKFSMSYEIAEALIHAGYTVDCRNNSLNTPLCEAFNNTNQELCIRERIILLLLRNNAELNFIYNIIYESPFQVLIKNSSHASDEKELDDFKKLIALCLRHGADVNNFNRDGTPFMYALKHCSSCIIDLMRPYVSYFDEMTCTFHSTVFLKAFMLQKKCVFDMINDGADINLCSNDISFLSRSIEWEDPRLFNYLWEHCDKYYVLCQDKFFLRNFLRNCSFSPDNFLKAFYLIYDSEYIETLINNTIPNLIYKYLKYKLITINISLDEAEKVIYTTLIYTNVIRFKDLRGFYSHFGFNKIFEAFLKVNVHIINFEFCKDCIVTRICCPHLDKTDKWLNHSGAPKSLLELCRNAVRANLQPKCNYTSNLYFEYYNGVQRTKFPPLIKDIISLKLPIEFNKN